MQLDLRSDAKKKALTLTQGYSIIFAMVTMAACSRPNASFSYMLGLIKRTFGYSNKTGIKTAFKAVVLPILEYAFPVWNPYLVKHNEATKAI